MAVDTAGSAGTFAVHSALAPPRPGNLIADVRVGSLQVPYIPTAPNLESFLR
jgi:hypothetical protein